MPEKEKKDLDLVSKLGEEERFRDNFQMDCFSPDDHKYWDDSRKLVPYLSAGAEWRACTYVQKVLLETRVEFGQAEKKHLDEVDAALKKIDPLNIALIEKKVTKHDQLAVIEEIGRFVSEETKALLHPGTTSFDPLDTARSYLLKGAWYDVIRPEISRAIGAICDKAEKAIDEKILQVGRTHLQHTTPVPFGATLALYVARLAERVEKCDSCFNELRGKISGIVGTGASIEMVIGEGKAMEFEEAVLKKLGLMPDYTATQIVQKEALANVGNAMATLMGVLADFANDMRILYSSDIKEITSRESSERLGGSSADAAKDNPINWENICGKAIVVESGMRVLYEMIKSDLQRDLRGSVMARYQPQGMLVQAYESFVRLNRELKQLSINADRMNANLDSVRQNPSEAMTAILRGEKFVHSKYGVGHDFVKEMSKRAKKENKPLIKVALEDEEFHKAYQNMSAAKRDILQGRLELYTGDSIKRAEHNICYAREIMAKK